MPKMLIDGAVEYEDGTPGTEAQVIFVIPPSFLSFQFSLEQGIETHVLFNFVAQMGKDVVSFLSWAAEPEMEERKLVCNCRLTSFCSFFGKLHLSFSYCLTIGTGYTDL